MVEYFGFYQRTVYSNGEYSVAVFSNAETGETFKVCGEGIPTAKKIKYHFIGLDYSAGISAFSQFHHIQQYQHGHPAHSSGNMG